MTTPQQPQDTILAVLGLAFFAAFLYGIYCMIRCAREKDPGVDWAWTVRSGFSRHNFTPRGQTYRRRAGISLLVFIAIFFIAGFYNKSAHPRSQTPSTQSSPF